MKSFSIESNGRLERTYLYYNGEQVRGIKEVMLNLDETGTFHAIIEYEDASERRYTKQIFTDYLEHLQTSAPTLTEEEAANLRLLTVESNGEIENTTVLINNEPVDGIVSLMLHIKSGDKQPSGIAKLFGGDKGIREHAEFQAEITFRYENDRQQTEPIF